MEKLVNFIAEHWVIAPAIISFIISIVAAIIYGTYMEVFNIPKLAIDKLWGGYDGPYCVFAAIPFVGLPVMVWHLWLVWRVIHYKKHEEVIIYFFPVAMLGLLWLI